MPLLAAVLVVLLPLASACGGDGGDPSGSDGGDTQTDAGPGSDADHQGSADARPTLADVQLTFSGTCTPVFAGRELVVVSNNESVAISSTSQPFISIQLDLHQSSGAIDLSTAQRIASGDVINVVSQSTTWTNISSQQPDPIDGRLVIDDYQEQAGIMDLTFQDVVLENVQDGSLCTVDGTLITTGTSF
jgi:hypothetical protein